MDIGGIEGLIPVAEIDWSHIDQVSDALAPGQEVVTIVPEGSRVIPCP